MFQTTVVEKIKTTIPYSATFFQRKKKKFAFCEKNFENYG
jgi:hypothetical protein